MNCAALVPASLRDDVEPADLPAANTIGDWVAFGDAQTGKLEQANKEKRGIIEIHDNCAKEQARIAERLKPRPWYRFWDPG
ncbi:MAG: hypothetical protein ACK4RV_10105 [Caulobacter sp.]